MATTTTSPQVVQSGLGSIGTPTISVGRTQIIEGGKLIGYREVVTVSNPTVINQLVHIALPSGRDPTPQTTYTMDRDLDGKLKSGTMVQTGGVLGDTSPRVYNIDSSGSLSSSTPNIALPASLSSIKLPDYSPFKFSDETGAATAGLESISGGAAGKTASFVGSRIDGAALGSSFLSGDTRGMVSEGTGIVGAASSVIAGAPLIASASLVPGGSFVVVAALAYSGNIAGKGFTQLDSNNPTFDGYEYNDGTPKPWGYNGETITRPAGWYATTVNPLIYQGSPADPAKTVELTNRTQLVEGIRAEYGDKAADQISRMNNDQIRSFVSQNPTDPAVKLLVPHLGGAVLPLTSDISALPQPVELIAPNEAFRRLEINQQNSTAPNGTLWGDTVKTAPNASETYTNGRDSSIYTKTIEIKNGDNTTRVEQVIDVRTGKVIQENTFERGLQDAPDGFKIVATSNYETGVGWAMNRETGKMEQTSVPTSQTFESATIHVFTPLTSTGVEGNSYTIQSGDNLSKIGKSLGLNEQETQRFIDDVKAQTVAQGGSGSVNDLKIGNTLALPKWVNDKLQAAADLDPTNPTGKNAVNGLDKQSDDAAAKREGEEAGQKWGDFGEDLTQTDIPAFTPLVATKDLPPDEVLTLAAADTDDGVVSDAGFGGYKNSSNISTNSTIAGVNTALLATNNIANPVEFVAPTTPVTTPTLNPSQNQTVNDALTASGLNLDASNPITASPSVNGLSQLTNAKGEIVGSIDTSQAGSGGTAKLEINGQPPQVIDRLGNSFDAGTASNLTNATGYLALGSTLLTLQNWADASDLSRAQTAVSLYNQINSLSKLDMPSMAGVGSVLSFYSACQNGDAGGIAYSGLQMVDTLTSTAATELTAAIPGWIGAIDPNIIPGLGLLLALTKIEENPLGVITAALNFFPPAGPFIGAVLNIIQTVFTPAPVSEGEAHATFDEFGHLNIITDSEKNGGGGTSSYWMDRLAQGAQLNGIQTPQAGAYVMGMPTIGYKYNPDGFNYENANGHLTLRWIGADGKSYTRTYDANGSRDGDPADAKNQDGITDIERDFQKLMHSSAKQYPPLAYEQLEGGILQLDYGVATVVYAVNTHKFDGLPEHTHGGDEDTDAAQDAICYILNSASGNEYAGYSINYHQKYSLTSVNVANDDVWRITA